MKRHATVTSESGATPHTDLSRFYLLFRIYRVTRTALAWYNGLYRVRPKARLKEGWAPPRSPALNPIATSRCRSRLL